ncbi:integral membrane protein [Thraustotheca clavata]|uniref:Integral membrane protein n=1 Tax=Thraustotheca clavata TaxID=74557 RepID=A0A1V9ZWM4_9STRA|nr:integral membrane protein [Thraustotheca clavata]
MCSEAFVDLVSPSNIDACWKAMVEIAASSESYTDIPPLLSNGFIALGFGVLCFILQALTGNYSHVDRLWSITPVLYSWNFLVVGLNRGYALDVRMSIVVGLITMWGVRLTYNFYRRGGYTWTGEDYRWEFVRKMVPNPFLWHIFSFVFIAVYQHILLCLLTFPLHVVFTIWANGGSLWSLWDTVLALTFLGLLLVETTADQQQYNFQETKWAMIKSGKTLAQLPSPYNLGFCTTGLFAYSRHPNFFAEISMWWVVYSFSLIPSGHHNWTLLGALNLFMLFQGSVRLTEYLTSQKYSKYAQYQKLVSMLLPMSTPVANLHQKLD